MNKLLLKVLGICSVFVLILAMSSSVQAATVWYEFSFTGADMMSYVLTPGADGSTAASNGVFNGARLQRREPGRTYVTSQQTAFIDWATSTTDRFLGFNLWGFDGLGANWGDDYKPLSWGSTSDPAGWSSWTTTWPWGTPPAGYHTDQLLGWDAASFSDGLNFGDSDLASKEFSFQVAFDTDDMFWGQSTNGAPNALPTLTFWFGGWFNDDEIWDTYNVDYYMYEGNMVLTGTPIPEPGTILLLGTGLIGLARFRRRSRKA